MKRERWQRVDELFASALERDGAARQAFLDEACAGDAALRAEVETMLRMARESEDFLETPVFPAAAGLLADETQRMESSSTPSGAIDNARFIPGDLVAGRYRIASLLGRGGMGEVYRADDLRLSQPVALKFLAEPLARDGAALARFHREVSVARQISHRHVCRVYDIGEHAGMHYLSMEYIRGEELSSLLKRIGRLPADKALETARQLCAGLAAIHAAGVLHRDLKPANIMLDEHGDVRITDFGIVALSEGVSGAEAMIGTPAYMSPEQREGGHLTTRSDLYSLGLVLYECFTGKRPSQTTTAPDLDPAVDRVITRCLESDPARRPASALQVAAALPGGDPLAAALAAGETPSPQMVAATPTLGSLRPAVAALLFLAIAGGIALIALLSTRSMLHRFLPLDRSPELLRERAANVARWSGHAAPLDTVHGFAEDVESFDYLQRRESSANAWSQVRNAQPPTVTFWYRESPRYLEPYDHARIDIHDPPNVNSGMITVRLDLTGRLFYYEAVPPQVDTPNAAATKTTDWSPFFEAAGLDAAAFRRIEPQWTPPQHSDARMAWSGTGPGRPGLPLRVEAAAYRGQPTYFDVIGPWRTPLRQQTPPLTGGAFANILLSLYFGAIALAALLAWKNVRIGRGDRRGAFRLALFTFAVRMVHWVVVTHHAPTFTEVTGRFVMALESALYWACFIALLHLALEPFLRRRWPEWIISWTRLLGGEVRDPLVGRDILIGGVLGTGYMLAGQFLTLLPLIQGKPLVEPAVHSPLLYQLGLLGARGFVPLLANQTSAALMLSFIFASVLLFFAMVTRNKRVAVAVSWVLFCVVFNLNVAEPSLLRYAVGIIGPTLLFVALTRYGVLTLVSLVFFIHLTAFYPVTTELSAWYATSFLMEAALLLAIALYALRTSLAGQKLWRGEFLAD